MDAKRQLRLRRHRRVRKKVTGSTQRPRLCVFRSVRHIYAQVIDDSQGRTLVAASTLDPDLRSQVSYGGNVDAARLVGRLLAERAQEQGIRAVVFDRGGFAYHGRVAGLAEGAREAGLEF
jgi:large subunit ribosomal protein L18